MDQKDQARLERARSAFKIAHMRKVGREFRALNAPAPRMPALKECDNPDCMDPDCARYQARVARDVPPGPAPIATITILNATLTGRACALARELQDEVSLQGVTTLHLEDCVELPDEEPPLVKGVTSGTLGVLWGVCWLVVIVLGILALTVIGAVIEGGGR